MYTMHYNDTLNPSREIDDFDVILFQTCWSMCVPVIT